MTKIKEFIVGFLVLLLALLGIGVIATVSFPQLVNYCTPPENGFNQNFGLLGDYIGGIFGTIFLFVSTMCLIYTLKIQNQEVEKNAKVYKMQQFDNVFFELLRLYQQYVETLIFDEKTGKAFFSALKEKMFNSYKSTQKDFKKRHKDAIECYVDTYIELLPQLGTYFRILYRIFDILSNSNISEEDKVKYAKIMRSQFSEDELFLIYYNSRSDYGEASVKYIKKFNLLKYLLILDKLEFKSSKKLDNKEIYSINLVLTEILDYLNTSKKKEFYKTYLKGRNAIKITPDKQSKLVITLYIKNSQIPTKYLQSGKGLESYSLEELSNLLLNVVSDYYISNNPESNLKSSEPEISKDKKSIVFSTEIK